MNAATVLGLLAAGAVAGAVARGEVTHPALLRMAGDTNTPPATTLEFPFAFPGEADVLLTPATSVLMTVTSVLTNATSALPPAAAVLTDTASVLLPATSVWERVGAISAAIEWPADGGSNAQVYVFVKDREHFWYQAEAPGTLTPGATNFFRMELNGASGAWQPFGHRGTLTRRSLIRPNAVGVRVLGKSAAQGRARIADARLTELATDSPPVIRNVLVSRREVPRCGKFEVTFELPDRYPNPFDPDQVCATASFTGPDGRTNTVDAFYTQAYVRDTAPVGIRQVPAGGALWCVRFTPTTNGLYSYRLHVRDAAGEGTWGTGTFTATPSGHPGFVRVDTHDPRYFAFDNGTVFFPIGHNTSSPSDNRMAGAFPWRHRPPRQPDVYARYFRDMAANGENLAEVWTSAWSLGLEWSPDWPGYHGIGDYNLMNAWELDRVVEAAAEHGVLINLVIHNHGKFSAYVDAEWKHNPFNTANGGYLQKPEEYFTDPRAKQSFLRLMRYMVARWGYSPNLFNWELWSELDLVGSEWQVVYKQSKDAVTDWHRVMAAAIRAMDPNRHLISTHFSIDYTRQIDSIAALPELDWTAQDAYYGSGGSLRVVDLIRATAATNGRYRKPTLITEFGGSSSGGDLTHLEQCLHAGLWASACAPVAGTAMFWWWQVIEEQGHGRKFAALQRFMRDVDRRGPDFLAYQPTLAFTDVVAEGQSPPPQLDSVCLKEATRAMGWIYAAKDFARLDPNGPRAITNASLGLTGMRDGPFRVEFWDTLAGAPMATLQATATASNLVLALPPFTRDLAFKLRALP